MKSDVLVLGGGAAGMTAAIELAGKGASVLLVERAAALGGRLSGLGRVFPAMGPGGDMVLEMRSVIDNYVKYGLITVLTSSAVKGA
ncbi:MAG TPA: FAD-dependent oxidoreductase, partial [Methanomassiliicoccales archaeon]|nr:FAD-dependent oxidoreductase [Methanomassiliicoccales archaeon]